SHLCPNGHRVAPTIDVAAETPFDCPVCPVRVTPPEAEALAFNSTGACPTCSGTGIVRTVDDDALVPDPNKTIEDGAVVPWQMFGFKVQPAIAREFGVRTDVAWHELTDHERDIVLDGPEEKKHITFTTRNDVKELDFTFRNARLTVTKELERAQDEKRLARVNRFLVENVCPSCGGTRLSETARTPRIGELDLADVTAMTLQHVLDWAPTVPATLPADMQDMADSLVATLLGMARRLIELGLGYLTLDRASATLSTGERQRVQLARAVRNRTTGVLYVLDEPSIGLHPANVDGLLGVMGDLLADGNSVLFVDHDVQLLRQASWLLEIGPGSGAEGGTVVAQGTADDLTASDDSQLAGFLTGAADVHVRDRADEQSVFLPGRIHLQTEPIHTVGPLEVDVPRGRLSAITGVSGSGKTTLVLESLVPALDAQHSAERRFPTHVRTLDAPDVTKAR